MKRSITLVIAAVLMVVAFPGRAQQFETVDSPFAKKAESLRQVSKAIKLTLLERQWNVDSETENAIQATLVQGDGRVAITVRIGFDNAKATISFVQDKSRENIQPYRYRGWVDNLAKDIPMNLQRVQILLD